MSAALSDPFSSALQYLEEFGWWIFPCQWRGSHRKEPLIERGFRAASRDRRQITEWWQCWPQALIAAATGASGLAVLDIDVKNRRKYGPNSLEELGQPILDNTWIAHTASGGWHVYYDALEADIPSSSHRLGLGIDVRANTGYIILPSPGSGYTWDPHHNPGTVRLAPAPAWLIPPAPAAEFNVPTKPVKPTAGLAPYADAAIEYACRAIRSAADGQQRVTLLKEAFTIGTLAGAGGIPPGFARAALIDAGSGMKSYDPKNLWTRKEIERVVNGAFDAGVGRPRPTTGRRAAR